MVYIRNDLIYLFADKKQKKTSKSNNVTLVLKVMFTSTARVCLSMI